MTKEIDARGLACPQPVILTRKALAVHDEVVVIVDNTMALENVKRMASSQGCNVTEEHKKEEIYVHIKRGDGCHPFEGEVFSDGPVVIVISGNTMGRGDDELGYVLVKSFIHTLVEASPGPDILIFLNTGVKLTVSGSEVIDDLKELSQKGTRILVCGTCLGFFELKDQLAAGEVSNMYDITETMLGAARLVQI